MNADELFQRYQQLQGYLTWTDEDARRAISIAETAERHFADLVDDFCAEIQRHPATAKVITGGEEQVDRVKGALMTWLRELFSGRYDRDYAMHRWKIGLRHAELGLDQVYTNAAMSRLRTGLLLALEQYGVKAEALAIRRSLNKLIDLDLAIIEDAHQTERRERQQRMERLAAIGQVAGGIAHELHNPLNVVKTSVYYLRRAKHPSPDKVATHLERIDRQVSMVDGVIAALNNFAQLPVPELRPVNITDCVRETLDLQPLPPEIKLVVDLRSTLPSVLGDRDQLLIVVRNVIRNARDAMPQGGLLRISGRQQANQVEIDISDTGAGIPPDNLGHIMEPLYSTKARGIGLGLSISRAILEKHQGQLRVVSEVGKGSTFTICLAAGT